MSTPTECTGSAIPAMSRPNQYLIQLTSARKRVDQAVFDTISEYVKDPKGFKGGTDKIYDIKNAGVGFGKLSSKLPPAVRKALIKNTNALAKQIVLGKVTPPTQ